jgi:hypothetical protein
MSLNLRNEVVMELENAGKAFRAHFPAGSTYQECFDALKQFADKIMEMSNPSSPEGSAEASASQPTQTEPPVEAPVETPTEEAPTEATA